MEKVVNLLNELNKADPRVLKKLIEYRVPCNEKVADHPTVQVSPEGDEYVVGLLGILNGLFDEKERLLACYDDDSGELLKFKMMEFD